MQQLSAWVGAGFVTAAVTAALFTGSGVAVADTESDSGSTSSSSSADTSTTPDKRDGPDKPAKTDTKPDKPTPGASSKDDTKEDTRKEPASEPEDAPEPESASEPENAEPTVDDDPADVKPKSKPVTPKKDAVAVKPQEAVEPAPSVEPAEPAELVAPVQPAEPAVHSVAKTQERQETQSPPVTSLTATRMTQAAVATTVAPPAPPGPSSVFDMIGAAVVSVIRSVGYLAISALQAVEALVTGPPVLPPNSTVTVRNSTITLSTGQRVAANWYYPEGDVPPDRMILLNHGFLALGPMYSYTAANLAEQTKSIVVTPSLPSNFFAADDHWLGGIGMAEAIADLFVGDREALTQSAIDAGYATRYGLDPETAALPLKFGLAGHSLGGQLVSGAAGFLAEKGAADNLVGVITLDGVPTGTTLADAIDKLDAYELRGGHYIPIREIGAPPNLFNSLSNVKESLNEGRPGRYNGVVLTGGVHMDSMRGGNPLIQFAAYLVAGFPQAQNPPAVDHLAATWFNQWFEGKTDIGDGLAPGSTIDIVTPQGIAKGVVIAAPTGIPLPDPRLVALSA